MKVILIILFVALLIIATLDVISMTVLDNNRKAQKAEIIFASLFVIVFLGGLITLIMYFFASLTLFR